MESFHMALVAVHMAAYVLGHDFVYRPDYCPGIHC